VRAKGLPVAVEFDDSSYAGKIAGRCQGNGLLLATSDNAITMFPPLNIERNIALKGLKILERCVSAKVRSSLPRGQAFDAIGE
jgi:4-aminobutyrate aminotransferase-like enzyme